MKEEEFKFFKTKKIFVDDNGDRVIFNEKYFNINLDNKTNKILNFNIIKILKSLKDKFKNDKEVLKSVNSYIKNHEHIRVLLILAITENEELREYFEIFKEEAEDNSDIIYLYFFNNLNKIKNIVMNSFKEHR